MADPAALLLPPNATPLERGLATVAARISGLPIDIGALWDPATCPITLLPWLTWALSIDRWDPQWSDEQKRAAVAGAIEEQRHKGTRQTVDAVLAAFDSLIELVEWFEASPKLTPGTFEVRLPLVGNDGVADGTRVSAAFARAIVAEVSRVKPVRSHFALVQQLTLDGAAAIVAAAQATAYRRVEFGIADPTGIRWADLLQDENGEPLEDDAGIYIDGTAT